MGYKNAGGDDKKVCRGETLLFPTNAHLRCVHERSLSTTGPFISLLFQYQQFFLIHVQVILINYVTA